MKNFINKIIYLIVIFISIMFIYSTKVEAKYVIEDTKKIITIKSADSEKPYINGRNYDVDYENFNTDVIIEYSDNLKINYAKYWFNSENKDFDGEGIDFENGKIFDSSGWYKIEVSDMYENLTTYIFFIDKEFNNVEIKCTNLTDDGGYLEVNATDLVTGVQKIEVYIKDILYKTYIYDEWFVKSKTEELFIPIDDLPFYEEAYAIATDFYGNTKQTDKLIPNNNRIYDLEDLIKFRSVINSKTTNFKDCDIYLLNDIDLASVCSSNIGSWTPIGLYNFRFSGNFEGNNHTISNLYINTENSYAGVFSYVAGSISNLTLEGNIANTGNYSGAFTGSLNGGKINNCINKVNITSNNIYIGGFVRN